MKIIIDVVYGVFIVESLTTTLTLKMKEIGVFGYNKRMKTLADNELGNNLFKEYFWG